MFYFAKLSLKFCCLMHLDIWICGSALQKQSFAILCQSRPPPSSPSIHLPCNIFLSIYYLSVCLIEEYFYLCFFVFKMFALSFPSLFLFSGFNFLTNVLTMRGTKSGLFSWDFPASWDKLNVQNLNVNCTTHKYKCTHWLSFENLDMLIK